ncbi:MAG: NHL repeat-containing protein [Salinivenus sp.]
MLLLPLLGSGGEGTRPVASRPPGERPDTLDQVRFEDAQAVSVDPRGRLYVADAGRDAVVILSPSGETLNVLGGAGTRAGQFLDPADVDPTNGQTLYVADAGNGRLQRFSDDLQYLESLPVGREFADGRTRRAFDDGRDGSRTRGDGRPIAVESSAGDHTFAIDEQARVVLKWDAQRRPERVVGDDVQSRGRLDEPVALALEKGRRLYVADRGREAILVYDRFGSFVRRLNTPALPEVRALTFRQGRLWVVCPDRLLLWNPDTERLTEHPLDLTAPLVDVAPVSNRLYVLTSTRLWIRDNPR